jgi:hypothetical protein
MESDRHDRSTVALAVSNGGNWVQATRFANLLLRRSRRVLLVTESLGEDGGALERGVLVVPLSPVYDPGLAAPVDEGELRSAAEAMGLDLVPLTATDRFVAAPLALTRVAFYGGGGAPFNQASILAESGFPIRFLSDADIRAGALDEVDVLVVPGGGFRGMHGQIEPLGEEGCRAITAFVRQGGMYVGMCAGSYDCAVVPEYFVRSCPAQRHLQVINARVWNDAEVDFGALQSPGVGVVTVRNERPDHPVMFGLPSTFAIVHYNGPIFEPLAEPAIEGASLSSGLAAFAGFTDRFTPSEAFAGGTPEAGSTLLERAIDTGQYSAVAGEFGRGRVVAYGSHPEFGFDLAMAHWGDAARMLVNTVLWQAASMADRPTGAALDRPSGRLALPAGTAYDEVATAAATIRGRIQAVRERPIEPAPGWLRPEYSLSLFGLPPNEIWRRSLDETDELAVRVADLATLLREQTVAVLAGAAERGGDDLTAAVLRVERWLLDERPHEWRQDGGYHGALALLKLATRMCDEAVARWEDDLGPPDVAYSYLHENPYHLVVGSYLAAIGCVAGAWHLLRAAAAELDMAMRVAGGPATAWFAPGSVQEPALTHALR